MPASNEQFIKEAFEAGLTEDQVRAAVKERNSLRGQGQQPDRPVKDFLRKGGDFLAGGTMNVAQDLSAALGMQSQLKEGEANLERLLQSGQMAKQAAFGDTSPEQKQRLLESSRAIDRTAGKAKVDTSGFSEDIDKSYLRRGMRTGVELGTLLGAPTGQLGTKTAAKRIASAALTGGEIGLLRGLSDLSAENPKEVAQNAFSQTLQGAIAGGLVQTGIEGVRGGVNLAKKGIKWSREKLTSQKADDIVEELKPYKGMREEAMDRDIDIAQTHIDDNYSDDVAANIKRADSKLNKQEAKLQKVIKNNPKRKEDLLNVIDDVVDDMSDEMRTNSQKTELNNWAEFQKERIVKRYGGEKVNMGGMLKEKRLAGSSGYTEAGDVVESTLGNAEQKYERKLRQAILDNASGAESKQIEKILKEHETAMFMKKMYENAAVNRLPRSTRRKIGALLFPSSLARQTVGTATQEGLKRLPISPQQPGVQPLPLPSTSQNLQSAAQGKMSTLERALGRYGAITASEL